MKYSDLQQKFNAELLIFDGGVGTEIYRHNYFLNSSFEQLSLSAPKVIAEIHRQYAEAGAQVLTTNTFNANRRKLSRFGLGEQLEEIIRKSIELARAAGSENSCLVAGAVGPADADSTDEEAANLLAEQGGLLLKHGADFLIFESIGNRADLLRVSRAVSLINADLPAFAYIASFAADGNAQCASGAAVTSLVQELPPDAPPAAIGLNCGFGPEQTLLAVEKIVPAINLPLVVQPNAGEPRKVDNRTIYLTSPEYFTTYAMRYVNCGARGVGGCCGITPSHIKDMARSVKPVSGAISRNAELVRAAESTRLLDPVPLAQRSKLGAKLAANEWIKSVEITPPPGFDLSGTVEKAAVCRAHGIDIINLPDGPRASARISSLVAAIEIQEKAGIEAMLHLCCRDRSLIALQSTLLACAAKNINNILFITGDPPKLGDYQHSSGVFDVDAIGLTRMAALLNRGVDAAGKELPLPTSSVIAVGADPSAIDPEREYRRLCEKAEAGAELIITQPVFSLKPLFAFLKRIEHLHLPLLAGVWPLASYRNAEFMRNEVPGVVVPDEVMLRMAQATGRDEQRAAGIAIARETLRELRGAVQGAQVSAPFGNVQTAIAVHEA